MKHETYVSFVQKMTPIWEDCRVDIKVAQKDPSRYTVYQMKTPGISQMKVAYDNEKVKKHIETLRDICEMVPQLRMEKSIYIILLGELLDKNLENMTDVIQRKKRAKQDLSLGELFMSMCKTAGIVRIICQDPDKPFDIYAIMKERIRSRYQE